MKNDENFENEFEYYEKFEEKISINFAKYDEIDNEFYYDKQSCNDNDETFADFIEIEFVYKHCYKTFSFNNKLHDHLRFYLCSKKQKIKNSSNNVVAFFADFIEIIKFKVLSNDLKYDVSFRNWNFLKTRVKFDFKDEDIYVCLNTDCDFIFWDKKFNAEKLINLQI